MIALGTGNEMRPARSSYLPALGRRWLRGEGLHGAKGGGQRACRVVRAASRPGAETLISAYWERAWFRDRV